MPTDLRRVNVLLEPELDEALDAYARRSGRSRGSSASMLIELGLLFSGDLAKPIRREERRGGARPGSGRPKVDDDGDGDDE